MRSVSDDRSGALSSPVCVRRLENETKPTLGLQYYTNEVADAGSSSARVS